MDWLERVVRDYYGYRDRDQVILHADLLAALRAAEPKGVRRWVWSGWKDRPYVTLCANRLECASIIPVEVREVKEEEPVPEPKPVDYEKALADGIAKAGAPPAEVRVYTEEQVREEKRQAWGEGWNALRAEADISENPYADPPIDLRALAAAKEWFRRDNNKPLEEARTDLARIIAKHYEVKK